MMTTGAVQASSWRVSSDQNVTFLEDFAKLRENQVDRALIP